MTALVSVWIFQRTIKLQLQLQLARENLSQGSRRMPIGTMGTEYTEQSIHNNKNT